MSVNAPLPESSPPASAPCGKPSLATALLGDRHFVVAAVILAVTAAGWGAATRWLGFQGLKLPVAWPQGVEVGEDFRLLSLPEEFGPFKKVRPNDDLGNGVRVPWDGEHLFSKTIMESLKIGTDEDRKRRPDRLSNWYVSRTYRDTRPDSPVRAWQLDVCYYTGESDTVPHVAEICAQAGGATILGSSDLKLNVPGLPEGWPAELPLRRTEFSTPEGRKGADYYSFSMNGVFTSSRYRVRWDMLNPFLRHTYFAKIQFEPVGWTSAAAEAAAMDKAAQDFLQYALPEVLKTLPSALDVENLEKAP